MLKNRPFIHLFTTNNKYYVFDVNTNVIIRGNEKMFRALKQILSGKEDIDITHDVQLQINNLISRGLLKPVNKDIEIEHPQTENVEYQLDNNIQMITLQLTQNCNLRCKYCVYSGTYTNRTHTNKRMSIDTAIKAIDFFHKRSSNTQRVSIGFYGGEPLLEFELIKKCVEYSETIFKGKQLSFNITTNATLINDEIIEYFLKHDISMLISLDGPKEIHDKSRIFADKNEGTFDTIVEKLERIDTIYPQYMDNVSFNVVFDTDNDFACTNDFYSNYETIKSSIITSTVVSENDTKENRSVNESHNINRNYETFKYFLSCISRLDDVHVSKFVRNYGGLIKNNIHNRICSPNTMYGKCHPSGPCIPGVQRPFITVDGDIYPCERVNETSEALQIGNIQRGFDVEIVKRILNVGKLTEKECKHCWAFYYCTSCVATADDGDKLCPAKRLSKCKEVRLSAEEMLKDYCALKECGYNFDN